MSGALTPDLTDGMPFQFVFSRLRQCRSRAYLWRETIPKLCRFVNPAKRHITPKIPLPELPFFMNFLFSSSFAPQNRGSASTGYLAGYRHIGSGNVIQPSRVGGGIYQRLRYCSHHAELGRREGDIKRRPPFGGVYGDIYFNSCRRQPTRRQITCVNIAARLCRFLRAAFIKKYTIL